MNRLERYLFRTVLFYFALSLCVLVGLFLVFDFLERIDNVIQANASLWSGISYFALKIPLTLVLMLPLSMLSAVLFAYGTLAKHGELVAMRAAGMSMKSFAKPVLIIGAGLSLGGLILNETVVPVATRKVKEIYNIDINRKDQAGTYSQTDLWWREGQRFFTVERFDSRSSELQGVSWFDLSTAGFFPQRRTDAAVGSFVDQDFGWSFKGIREYRFADGRFANAPQTIHSLALPLRKEPRDFYDVRTDRFTLGFLELRKFIKSQQKNGIKVSSYYADLYEKLAFPWVTLLCGLVVLPFAVRHQRSGGVLMNVAIALAIAFSYYAVHYFSLALGRAQIWPALLAAFMANIILGAIAVVLNAGAESPK